VELFVNIIDINQFSKNQMNKVITFVAGEPSGDLLAANVLHGMKTHSNFQNVNFQGIGGPRMMAEGFDSHWDINQLSVRGYVEAIKQLPAILKIRSELIHSLISAPPSVYIGVDAPDFNLGVEKKCRSVGIPTVHFISPSIWAWRGGRIKGIKEAVDHMLCIFPFEPEIYKKAGIRASYVGHPLATTIPLLPNPQTAKNLLNLMSLKHGPIADQEVLIAVLPGSRQSEIKLIAPTFFEAMKLMVKKIGKNNIRFLIPVATPMLREPLQQILDHACQSEPGLRVEFFDGQASLVLEAADSVLIASGTATLEAALWKKPMVISYKVPWLTGQIMKRQAYLPYVGLPNILAGEFLVPELLQDAATPEALATETLSWLSDSSRKKSLIERFERIHEQLMRPTADLASQAIAETMR
jgi:lipid-A-disaccharide synthase